ncbi:MAG TPA: sulfotransferase [Rhizomicrobium sp.]|jgi:hypothetical protein|nr:sulfotransferase [Rhizomicrobium sp.]
MSEDISESSPIVVGGTGGSGTRAIVKFLDKCGVDMGAKNAVGDAVSFVALLDRHINSVLGLTKSTRYDPHDLPAQLRDAVVSDYLAAAREHRAKHNRPRAGAWGFKNPRHIFLLPLLNVALPKVIFVHAVRDGRDMLLSENIRQPKDHFQALFGYPFSNSPDDTARFWSLTNLDTRRFGRSLLADRYVCVRIEDLCGPDPQKHVEALAEALGLDPERALRRARIFQDRESYGRGKAAQLELSPKTRVDFEAALSEFGYLPKLVRQG